MTKPTTRHSNGERSNGVGEAAGEPGGNRTHNPQIKNPFPIAKTLVFQVNSRARWQIAAARGETTQAERNRHPARPTRKIGWYLASMMRSIAVDSAWQSLAETPGPL